MAGVLLALCAGSATAEQFGGLYVHDTALASRLDAADSAAQAAQSLKPYYDQLANLQALATQEDLANATLIVSRRDEEVAGLIGAAAADRLPALQHDVCRRLDALIGAGACVSQDLQALAGLSDAVDNLTAADTAARRLVASDVARRLREVPVAAHWSCPAGADKIATGAPIIAAAHAAGTPTSFIEHCAAAAVTANALKSKMAEFNIGQGAVAAALATLAAKQAQADPTGPTAAMDAQIQQLAAAAKVAQVTQLDAFETQLSGNLGKLTPVLKALALTKLQAQLDQLLLGASCAVSPAPAPPAAATAAATAAAPADSAATSCKTLKAASTAGDANAVVSFAQNLAALSDAEAARIASQRWLTAAKAIVAVYKTDAQLQADFASAAASSARRRYQYLMREASLLAMAQLISQGKAVVAIGEDGQPGEVVAPPCDAASAFDCALPNVVASWNYGAAPAQGLAYRDLQGFRQLQVQRQRNAAAEQQALMLAGSASLKAYGDGGLQPQLLVQVLAALGLIGVAAK